MILNREFAVHTKGMGSDTRRDYVGVDRAAIQLEEIEPSIANIVKAIEQEPVSDILIAEISL